MISYGTVFSGITILSLNRHQTPHLTLQRCSHCTRDFVRLLIPHFGRDGRSTDALTVGIGPKRGFFDNIISINIWLVTSAGSSLTDGRGRYLRLPRRGGGITPPRSSKIRELDPTMEMGSLSKCEGTSASRRLVDNCAGADVGSFSIKPFSSLDVSSDSSL